MERTMIFEAIEFAAKAHRGQYRKGTNIPYIVHPIRVAQILIEYGCSEPIVIAGVLHDTVEDTAVSLDDIRHHFGKEVAQIVDGASEPDRSDTWEHRKQHTIDYLQQSATEPVLLVGLADKLDNIRSIYHGYSKMGDRYFKRFNRPKAQQKWYYQALADVFAQRLLVSPINDLAREFIEMVNLVFENHQL